MAYIKTSDGTSIYYKRWGSGEPIVFAHGWPLSADTWDGIALRLAKHRYQAICYDRRGFGRSDQPWSGYDYDTLAVDLSDLIGSLDLPSVHLVGFSMGGGDIVRYVSNHSAKRVKSMTLISSVVPLLAMRQDHQAGVPVDQLESMKESIAKDRPEFFVEFFPKFFGIDLKNANVKPSTIEWARSLAMQAGLKGTLDCIDSFGQTDFREELASIDVPTLVIHGTKDEIVPPNCSRLAKQLLPSATLHEIQDGSHGLLATHEKQLADLMETHFKANH